MKQLLIKIWLAASMWLLYDISTAATSTGDVSVVLTYIENEAADDDILPTEPSKHHRMPPPPIYGLLSKTNGVQIAGVDTTLIGNFEIYDANGNTLAIVADEISFIEILFSLHEEVRIVFKLNDCTLFGWITID